MGPVGGPPTSSDCAGPGSESIASSSPSMTAAPLRASSPLLRCRTEPQMDGSRLTRRAAAQRRSGGRISRAVTIGLPSLDVGAVPGSDLTARFDADPIPGPQHRVRPSALRPPPSPSSRFGRRSYRCAGGAAPTARCRVRATCSILQIGLAGEASVRASVDRGQDGLSQSLQLFGADRGHGLVTGHGTAARTPPSRASRVNAVALLRA